MYNYNDYLKDTLPSEQYITYINYCTENLDRTIDYSEYIVDHVDKIIYNDYRKSKQEIQKEERIEKLNKLNSIQ
jgi:hypothetical protein